MNELEEQRLIINGIDDQLTRLFEQRMAAVAKIVDYKQKHGLPTLDTGREAANRERCGAQLSDVRLKPYFFDWYQHTMDISKLYQEDLKAEKDR
jgi:monofunctional chorismate mutase